MSDPTAAQLDGRACIRCGGFCGPMRPAGTGPRGQLFEHVKCPPDCQQDGAQHTRAGQQSSCLGPPLDARVLRVLSMTTGRDHWLTAAAAAQQVGIARDVARSVLVRLRARGLAEDDGEHPQAFGRTARGDWILEHQP